MKSFLNFLSEAPSQPAKDAARKGWKGDGHGNWIDHTGRIVAKTDHGKLKIYDKKEAEEANSKKIGVKQENPKGSIKSNPETERRIEKEPVKSDTSSKVEPSPIGGSAPPPPPSNADGSPKEGRGNMTIVFGRFNPPTVGHKKLLDTAKKASGGGQLRIYPSRSQDSKKNPLEPEQKVEVMGKMFPDYATHIVNDPNAKTIFDALKQAYDDGFNNVKIVVGDDRLSEFDKLSQNYNGKLYNFGNLETISAGERDPDGEDKTTFTATAGQTTFSLTYTVGYIDVYLNGVRLPESEYMASNGTSVVLDDGAALGDIIDIHGVEGMSASKMRLAAAENDFDSFRKGIPTSLDDKITKQLFNTVRTQMNVFEGWNLWEIAPKFDWKNLRENYVSGKIFKVNQLVENLNTGLIGKVMRRGTNYLICVTENNIMFKSWIKDLNEYTEVRMKKRMRDEKHPNTLVGTSGYRKNVQSSVPGQKKINNFNIKEFLNRYKKKSI